MTRTSFGDQLQQMWRTRPVRLPRHGPIAGVAAGFGRRYNVDPVLIRVAFVVSSMFGGAGIMLYLLGWLLLAEAGERQSPAESLFGRRQPGEPQGQSSTKTIVLLVALAIAVTTVGPIGVEMAGSGMISLALMLAGWWMLFMRFPEPPPGTSPWNAEDTGPVENPATTATGYPGTVFPTGPPRTPGGYFAPFGSAPQQSAASPETPMYTPYTTLPDSYTPEPRTDVIEPDPATTPADPPVTGTGVAGPTSETPGSTAEQTAAEKSGVPDSGSPSAATPVASAPADPATDSRAADSPTTAAPTAQPAPGGPNLKKSPADGGARSAPAAAPTTTSVRRPDIPPTWDPLGVAPLAWDLPEPSPSRPVVTVTPPRPKSRFTPVVLGLAILAAAGAGAVAAAGADWMTPARIAAVALAVIGLGLVVGAFLRRGHGLLVVTAPLVAFVLLAAQLGSIDFDRASVGERVWTPASIAELEQEYRLTMGNATLDLRGLKLTEDRAVDVGVQMGELRVLVPADLTLRTDCHVSLGDMQCPQGLTGPQTPGAPVLDLNIDVNMGNVEVHRD